MKNIVKSTFSFHLTVLRLIGLYPPKKHRRVYKMFSYFMYIFFILPLPVFGGMYLCLQENINFTQVCDNAFVVFELGCFIFKLSPFIRNEEEIKKCIYLVNAPVFNMYNKRQEKFIEDFIKTCRRNCKLYVICALSSVTMWAIKPIFSNGIRLPVDVWLPYVNPTLKTDGMYFFTYIMLVLGCTNGAIANGVIDPLISGLMYFASSQIVILKDNLLHLNDEEKSCVLSERQKVTQMETMVIYNRIKKCIEHYNSILNFVQSLETTFSSVVFLQFLVSVLVIGISCLQLTIVEPFTVPFFAMVVFLVCMLTQIFLYSYYGTVLFEEHNTLIDAIYMCPWYEFATKSKKALIILMERSKRPMIITAGKILDVSLTTFATILRRAYSLLAVLQNYK